MSIDMDKLKLVLFDIDDTLVVKSSQYMPEAIPRIFAALRAKGIKIGLATGRASHTIVEMVHQLHPDFYVTLNGQIVSDASGKRIYHNPFAIEDIDALIAWCRDQNIAYGMIGADEIRLSEHTDMIEQTLTSVLTDMKIDPLYYQKESIYQFWTFSQQQQERFMTSDLLATVDVVRWHPNSCDILPKKGSKANGVAQLLAHLSLDPQEIIVFGDGLNDLELFEYAGFAVAMGNAVPELKQRADYVTKELEDDGILAAFTRFGLFEK